MASDIKSVIYTDDGGRQYNVGLAAYIFTQDSVSTPGTPSVGGADYTGVPPLDPMPRNLRPRTVTVATATHKRRVMCLTADAPLYVGADTALNLQDGAGTLASYTRYRASGESFKFVRNPAG